jgi:hypothetical protein
MEQYFSQIANRSFGVQDHTLATTKVDSPALKPENDPFENTMPAVDNQSVISNTPIAEPSVPPLLVNQSLQPPASFETKIYSSEKIVETSAPKSTTANGPRNLDLSEDKLPAITLPASPESSSLIIHKHDPQPQETPMPLPPIGEPMPLHENFSSSKDEDAGIVRLMPVSEKKQEMTDVEDVAKVTAPPPISVLTPLRQPTKVEDKLTIFEAPRHEAPPVFPVNVSANTPKLKIGKLIVEIVAPVKKPAAASKPLVRVISEMAKLDDTKKNFRFGLGQL